CRAFHHFTSRCRRFAALLRAGAGSSPVRARSARVFVRNRLPPHEQRTARAAGDRVCGELSAPSTGILMEGRPVRDSASEYSELALPNDSNGLGNVLGGKVMHLVDLAAAISAIRHARHPVVTASVDNLHFLQPVHIGELIILRASVNRVFRTSMEVGVKVMTERLLTGERRHTCSAYLTFVALNKEGKAV